MELDISYVDSWELRDKQDVHPSHRKAVVEVKELLTKIYMARDQGNLAGEKGFSAALLISEIIKELERKVE